MTATPYGIHEHFPELCVACLIIGEVWWKVFHRLFEATRRAKGGKLIYTSLQPADSFLQPRSLAAGWVLVWSKRQALLLTNRPLPTRIIGFVWEAVHYKLIAVNVRRNGWLKRARPCEWKVLACRMCDDFLTDIVRGRGALLALCSEEGLCHSWCGASKIWASPPKVWMKRLSGAEDGSIERKTCFLLVSPPPIHSLQSSPTRHP